MSKKTKQNTSEVGSILLMYWHARELGWTIEECVRSYFYSYKMKKGDWSKRMIGSIVDHFAKELEIKDGKKRLGFLLHAIWRAWERETSVVFPLFKGEWTAKSGFNISDDFALEKFLKPMVEKGYIELVKGDSYTISYDERLERPSEIASFSSRIKPTALLSSIFYKHKNSCLSVKDMFVMWDADLHPVIVKKSNSDNIQKIAASNRELKKLSREVNYINKNNLKHRISLNETSNEIIELSINEIEYSIKNLSNRIESVLLSEQGTVAPVPPEDIDVYVVYITRGFVLGETQKSQHLWELAQFQNMQNQYSPNGPNLAHLFHLSRIFSTRKNTNRGGSKKFFSLGGRLYCNGSNMPSKSLPIRQGLLIDGEDTVELDYSSLHFGIAASEAGINLDPSIDPYWSDDIMWQAYFLNRSQAKQVLAALINCKNRQAASLYLKDYGMTLKGLEGILESRGLEWIKDFIGTDAGLRFQKVDSDMAVEICSRFQKETSGEAILPYHDSFIVKQQHEDILKRIMDEVAQEIIGKKIKIKKDNKKCQITKLQEMKKESCTAKTASLPGSVKKTIQEQKNGIETESCTDQKDQQLSEKNNLKYGIKTEGFNAKEIARKLKSFLERNAG